mmetsp:Transcript_17363/g.26539  ORF Transcript_17363/g.26539 Transcript_17363/m.26539 type:complete len:82 (-) Transcript_17363:171-416(-)
MFMAKEQWKYLDDTVEYIMKSLIIIGDSVTSGVGGRFQPSFSKPVKRFMIYKGLRILRDVIIDLNLERYEPDDIKILKRLS